MFFYERNNTTMLHNYYNSTKFKLHQDAVHLEKLNMWQYHSNVDEQKTQMIQILPFNVIGSWHLTKRKPIFVLTYLKENQKPFLAQR